MSSKLLKVYPETPSCSEITLEPWMSYNVRFHSLDSSSGSLSILRARDACVAWIASSRWSSVWLVTCMRTPQPATVHTGNLSSRKACLERAPPRRCHLPEWSGAFFTLSKTTVSCPFSVSLSSDTVHLELLTLIHLHVSNTYDEASALFLLKVLNRFHS